MDDGDFNKSIYIEIVDSKKILRILCSLILFYILIYFSFHSIHHVNVYSNYNIIPSNALMKKTNYINISFNNLNNSNYALLSIQFLHNSSKKEIKKPLIIQARIKQFSTENILIKALDTSKVYGKINYNSAFIPVYFTYTNNISLINIFFILFSSNPYIEYVNVKWEVEPKEIMFKSFMLNSIMLILSIVSFIFSLYSIYPDYSSIQNRTKFALFLFILNIFSHFPFNLIFKSMQIYALVTYSIRCISFGFYFCFWRLKVFKFNINEFKKQSRSFPLYLGILSSIILIYSKFANEFNLLMMPMSHDGTNNLKYSNQYLSIQLILINSIAFLMNFADILDTYSKSENEKYLIDNLVTIFSSLMNGIFFLNKIKSKKIIDNQVDQELTQILWDIAIFYEVFASRSITQNGEGNDLPAFEKETENQF